MLRNCCKSNMHGVIVYEYLFMSIQRAKLLLVGALSKSFGSNSTYTRSLSFTTALNTSRVTWTANDNRNTSSTLHKNDPMRMCNNFVSATPQSSNYVTFANRVIPPFNWSTFRRKSSDHGKETIEKKLIKYMDMWEVEKAVALMKSSVHEGNLPHENIILNLLQQLANLGEVECLLSLHEFLIDFKLCSETKFFKCLQEAYYNSGRVEEGVSVLRLLYHRTRKYQSIDTFFTLITVMVIEHFPHKMDVIEGFVEDCDGMEVHEPKAGLWKSYILTEHFDKAAEVLKTFDNIEEHIPTMINDIVSRKNNVNYNGETVLKYLLSVELPIKSKQKTLILETYLQTLCHNKQYKTVLEELMKAKKANVKLNPSPLSLIIKQLETCSEFTDEQLEQLTTITKSYL